MRYLYDLTTSAHWGGADVGILRVERQFARRARQHLGEALEFCVYDRFRNLFLTISDEIAAELIAGRTQVDFTPPAAPSVRTSVSHGLTAARARVRRALRANAVVYQAFQRLRGRSLSRDEIIRIQAEEFAPLQRERAKPQGPIPITHVPHRRARLDGQTLVISGGLDWDFKDVRALTALKRNHAFQYCTIIHDIIPILFPHLVVPQLVNVFAEYFSVLIHLADYAMCNSEATRRDWSRYCGERGVTMSSFVFPMGTDLPIADVPEVDLPEPLQDKQFALFVSTIEPRKNHRTVYEAWDRCIRSKTVDPERDRLVFVGRRGWAIDDLMREVSVNPATRDTIIVLNHVPDGLLRLLYQHAAFAVFPSIYEGYGLPLAEALAYGKPCISSNAGSLPEIGGDLVTRIDPNDTLAWARTIADYLRSPGELEARSQRIRAEFRPVTWDDAASRFFGILKQIERTSTG